MAVQTLPDVSGALRERILSLLPVTALVGGRVAIGGLNAGWAMPTAAILLMPMGGPVGLEEGGLRRQRFEAWCYGSTLLGAATLWRTLDPLLAFRQDSAAFLASDGTLVIDIAREGELRHGLERDTEWPRGACSYLVTYSGIPR